MKLTDIFREQKRSASKLIEAITNPVLGMIKFNLLNNQDYNEDYALKLGSVYRAVNVISDSVAVLPFENYIIQQNWKYRNYDNLYYLLNVQPNNYMSAFTFKKMIVQYVLLRGNAYIFIDRNLDNSINSLHLINSDLVQVLKDNSKIYYKIVGLSDFVDYGDIIHIMNYSNNGLLGISTLEHARQALNINIQAETHAENFFSNGGNLSGILSPKQGAVLKQGQGEKAKSDFIKSLSNNLGGKSGGVVVLDNGFEYQSVSINPKDSQLIENRQFNILSICQYFGVPPSKLFDLSNTTYNTAEAVQIDFLNSTLLPLLEKIEIEFYRKLFLKSDYATTELKFDVSNLMRLDAKTQAEVLTKYVQIGGYTVNEVREKLGANFPVKNGNRAMIMQNMQPLDNILNDIKAGVNNNTDTNNNLDNGNNE